MRTRIVVPMFFACLSLLAVAGQNPAHAQRGTARKSHAHSKRVRGSAHYSSTSRAQAWKRLKDYNYVKYFGPISGSMYRSTKW